MRGRPAFDSRPAIYPELGATVVHTILWLIAAILVIAGIVTIFRGGLIVGIILIVVGLLVGPGGVSIFS
jgi:hypothetical protein